jgi:HlyD family secretion protein
MSHKKFSLVMLIILAAVSVAACGSAGGRSPTPTPIPALVSYEKAIFTVEMGSIVSEKELMGEIVPAIQDELFFRASGFATRVTVKNGDYIKKGEVIAEMQIDDLLNQLQQANIDLEVAEAEFAKYQSERQYDLDQAWALVVIRQKEVELARLSVENSSGIEKVRAQLQMDITEQNMELAEKAFQLKSEQTNPYQEQVVKRNQLSVARLEALIAERQIIAPYDCVILKSLIRPGQQVDAYFIAFNVGDPSNLVIRTQYDWELVAKLTARTEADLRFTTDEGERFPIAYLPNFSPASTEENPKKSSVSSDYLYYSLPENVAEEEIIPGRTVFLTIILGRKDDAMLLPPAAIREYKGLKYVIVLEGDRRRRVEIQEVGLQAQDKWEIIADLQVGDQVLGP